MLTNWQSSYENTQFGSSVARSRPGNRLPEPGFEIVAYEAYDQAAPISHSADRVKSAGRRSAVRSYLADANALMRPVEEIDLNPTTYSPPAARVFAALTS